MRVAIRKSWPGLLAGLMLLLGIASALNTASDLGRPFYGIVAYRNHLRNVWQVEPSTPSWWQPLATGQLRYDDVLLALEDEPYTADSFWHQGTALRERGSVRLTISRSGVVRHEDLPVVRFTLRNFLDLKLPDLINGLAFWVLAVAVFRARPDDPVNRTFTVTTSLMAGAVSCTTPSLFPEAGLATRAIHLAWCFAAGGLATSFIHLALLFPQAVRWADRRLAWSFAALTVALGILYAASMVLEWSNVTSPYWRPLSTVSNGLLLGLYGVGLSSAVVRLSWLAWRRDSSRRLRRQALFILGGLAMGSPYVVIMAFRSLGIHGHFWNGLDLRCMFLFFAIMVAFVILRYQTFQRAHPAVVAAFTLVTSALIASIGGWLLRLLEPEWANTQAWPPFLALFSAAFVPSVLWTTQLSWPGAFGRFFHWDRQTYSAARQFGQQVVSQTDIRYTPRTIAEALVSKLELERAAVWLLDETTDTFRLAAHAGTWPRPLTRIVSTPLQPDENRPMRLLEPGSPPWTAPLREAGIEVVIPLWASRRPVGLLGLGKRWDEEIFDERDFEIVELIAQQAALFLLTATQLEELRQVPHQIAATQERERFKIAQELHDTVQQFLGRLPFYLEVSRNAARDDPAETESILERCMADVEGAAQTVREIRANLAPLQLEKGLVHPLQRLIEQFGVRTGVVIESELAGDLEASLSLEARHALYRVMQQALDNVAAHAQARRVHVTLARDDGRVRLAVSDDGCGFSARQRTAAENRGSFGLKSMHARIATLGGELTTESGAGLGTRVSGWLPLVSRNGSQVEG